MAVSRVLMELLPTGCSTQDWTCLFSDEFSAKGIKLQFSQYQNQNTPVYQALIRSICSTLRYRNIDTLGHLREYTGDFPHEVSATDT